MEETIESTEQLLERLGKLSRARLAPEAEDLGLEVDPDWTKAQIMTHLEEHLGDEVEDVPEDPEVPEDDEEEDDTPSPADNAGFELPEPFTPPPYIKPEDILLAPSTPRKGPAPHVPRGWGRNPGSHAP